ncbi:MAG: helix-turn-helix transcriptional regulator [Cyclobacterium sp.]|uniref:helix-turn-helix domain-containing protein n=1 Tax=Cyclobacterium sp. TaxID=1966343 RepID=UPI0039705F3D
MTDRKDMPGKIHQGRNIKRFREMLGIKQESLAHELGPDWSQKKISLLEQKETVEVDILAQVSEILKIPVEAIQNFDEEQAVNIISNTFNIEKDAYVGNSKPTFNINPIEEIKKLHEEKIALYERMLKEKDEMMARLETLLQMKKVN